MFSLIEMLGLEADTERVELLQLDLSLQPSSLRSDADAGWRDGIEFVVRKRHPEEVARKKSPELASPSPLEVRMHLNRYRDDIDHAESRERRPSPFENEDPL